MKNIIIFLLLVIISGLAYLPIKSGFFAQDEWYAFGNYINKGFQVVTDGLIPGQTHYIPLTHIINFLTFENFGLNYDYHAYLSIILHILSTLSVYFFIKELTQNRLVSAMTGLLFALSPGAHQATSWVFADTSNHWSYNCKTFQFNFGPY